MNLQPYYEMQRKLDDNIVETKSLQTVYGSKSFKTKQILAFKQELGEFLQRLPKVFKFWSNKTNKIDEETLEEWIDGFHFLLSIGLVNHYNKRMFNVERYSFTFWNMEDVFTDIYNNPIKTFDDYELVFHLYYSLIRYYGYKDEDIKKAYDKKNKINFDRQAQGY